MADKPDDPKATLPSASNYPLDASGNPILPQQNSTEGFANSDVAAYLRSIGLLRQRTETKASETLIPPTVGGKPMVDTGHPQEAIEAAMRKYLPEIVAFIWLQALAFPFFHAGADAMLNDRIEPGIYGYLIGGISSVAGFTFHWWKKWPIWKRVQRFVIPLWPAPILLAFIYIAGPEMYRRATQPVPAPALPSSTGTPPEATSLPKSPFLGLDDAKRWQMARTLFHTTVSSNNNRVPACHALIWEKPDSKSAAAFWNESNLIFYLGDWGVAGGQPGKSYFPDGITISAGTDHGDAYNCGFRLSEWLQSLGVQSVKFQDTQSTPALKECKNECVEMVIGDVTIR